MSVLVLNPLDRPEKMMALANAEAAPFVVDTEPPRPIALTLASNLDGAIREHHEALAAEAAEVAAAAKADAERLAAEQAASRRAQRVAPTSVQGETSSYSGGGNGDPSNPATWDRLAQCESGGNWATNTGNGYSGGIQFSLTTWRSVGGTGEPWQNSREEQIHRGQILQARSGWGQWPACTRSFGWR